MLDDFDDSVQNKTSSALKCVFLLIWTLYQVILQVFGLKICEKKTALLRNIIVMSQKLTAFVFGNTVSPNLQNVYLDNIYILMYRHARCNCK